MRPIANLAVAAALLIAAPAIGQEGAAPAPEMAAPDAFGPDAAVAADDLGRIAGKADIGTMIAEANQRNTVTNNSVTGNSVTGSVAIDGNAFQNLQGMAVISANSGNNVAMNAALNVTINMAPR